MYRCRAALLVAPGMAALSVGLLVYLTDRDPSKASLILAVSWLQGAIAFGAVGGCLPTLAHTFAFSLFTAAALPRRSSPPYGACVTWFALNAAFEVGQHPQVSLRLAALLERDDLAGPLSSALANYFVRGTFDVRDIGAALIGAVLAGATLRAMHNVNWRKSA